MRSSTFILLAASALTGCAATSQEVVFSLNDQYDQKTVDAIVLDLGPPAQSFKMVGGETEYQWIVSNHTNVKMNDYGGTANTFYCKVRAIVRPDGIVRTVSTEDVSNVLGESLCAMHFHQARKSS